MAIGIIRFPGTNCDRDVYKAIELIRLLNSQVEKQNISGGIMKI